MFATIYDDYIKHKHCVKDILSIIHQNDDIIKETYTNNTLKRTPINILCIDETKLDNSFPMVNSKQTTINFLILGKTKMLKVVVKPFL